MSVLQKLTEGIVNRNIQKEGEALLSKWEQTGLLEGMDNENARSNMAVLLENQAKELLREASSMAAGDVEGFASVAFPIVRRVFGGLIANQLVSVQPMSLPAGLIFFLDFTYTNARAGRAADESLYGGNVVGKEIIDGVTLGERPGGFYNLNTGYSSPTGSATLTTPNAVTGHLDGSQVSAVEYDPDLSGEDILVFANAAGDWSAAEILQMNAKATTAITATANNSLVVANTDENSSLIDTSNGDLLLSARVNNGAGATALGAPVDDDDCVIARLRLVRRHTDVVASNSSEGLHGVTNINQLVFKLVSLTDAGNIVTGATPADLGDAADYTLAVALAAEAAGTAVTVDQTALDALAVNLAASNFGFELPIVDNYDAGGSLGSLVGANPFALEGADDSRSTFNGTDVDQIPEIDIKVDSVSVTAVTKKLKAKWTPELSQDLNAFHNMDAEVELTSILSEQIALEIDQEILNDLVKGATAGTFYWSRRPGRFVNRTTGADLEDWSTGGIDSNNNLLGADFTGTVSEWYETLIETINDISAQIHRKTLRGGANFLVCGPETANVLEFTAGFRASVTHDADTGQAGTVKIGAISKKFDVYVDPYFPRNAILVGRKGASFLESGYVYAPYVPLQVTPTIFGVEDFVPRKGVMTRYAKKMVRPDMYGLVVIKDFLG